MSRLSRHLLATLLVLTIREAWAQTDPVTEARTAMDNGEYPKAAALLSEQIKTQPSADAYVYLGISYAHMREWMRAEETLKEGASRYPKDPRFHNELAGVYLAANDLTRARQSLQAALETDPSNKYAADLIATIDMSMGNVETALKRWNMDGRPIIGDILHNGHVELENWTVGKASSLKTGDTLTWGKWRTTERRLWETDIYANVGVEVEPTSSPDRYTAVVRTVPKTSKGQMVMPLLETLMFQMPTIHVWNIKNSGVTMDTGYRFATNRHLGEVGFLAPLPLPGILFLDATGSFRSERWDISPSAVDNGVDKRFYFQSTGVRAMLRHIPHYRIELGAGFEYRNRTASGDQPKLSLDNRNTGKMLFELTLLPADGRLRSRIHATSFVARKKIMGDMDYSGGTLEWNNRYFITKDRKNTFEFTGKTGTSRRDLPVDDYFVLGVGQRPENYLRGHDFVSGSGHYGNSPMGTSFWLVNTTYDRLIRRLPFFNVLNFPYVDLKWLVFVDGARTFDRADVFKEGKTLVDAGAGFKLETPTGVFNLTYGRSLRDGSGTLSAYAAKRW